MRENIFFDSKNEQCAGYYYPSTLHELAPAIVMAHGLSGVKEMGIEYYADSFNKAGFAVLLFDYRFIGASTGQPRDQNTPTIIQEDFKNALHYLSNKPDIDANRIGVWGTSFSGGQVIEVAFQNKDLVRCLFSQVPALSPKKLALEYSFLRRNMLKSIILGARLLEWIIQQPLYIPLSAPSGKLSALGADSFPYLRRQEENTNFVNKIRLRSLSEVSESNPISKLPYLHDIPKLFALAKNDTLVSYEKSAQWLMSNDIKEQEIVAFDGNHYDVYDLAETQSEVFSYALQFFNQHLISNKDPGKNAT